MGNSGSVFDNPVNNNNNHNNNNNDNIVDNRFETYDIESSKCVIQ